MILYLVTLIFTITGSIVWDLGKTKRYKLRKILWWYLCIILILIIGLRYCVGGDTWAYMGDYEWRASLDTWKYNPLDPFQPGYTLLCALGKSISPDFYVFQLIHATIVNILLFYFIQKNTKYIFSALIAAFLTCYLYFTMEILREVLAILIFVLNYESYKNGQWIKFYLGVLMACCFHISAIFLVLLPLCKNLRINGHYAWISLCLFVSMIFLRSFLDTLSTIAAIGDKVSSYKDLTTTGLLSDTLTLIRQTIFPVFYVCIAKYLCKQPVKFETPIAIMSLFGIAAFFSPIIFSRATNYFILFFSVSIADFCVGHIRKKYYILRQYSVLLTILFFSIYGSEYIMYHKYKRWIPYYSIFNPVIVDRDNYATH